MKRSVGPRSLGSQRLVNIELWDEKGGDGIVMFEAAKDRLLGLGYQILPVQGEPLHIVFFPPRPDGTRHMETMDRQRLIELAEQYPAPDEERKPIIDLNKVGIVALLRKTPMGTDAEGEPKLQIVLEITGRKAVDSIPIEDLRDMLGKLVLVQINAVQLRFNLDKKAGDHA